MLASLIFCVLGAGPIDVTTRGVVADGETDCLPALQKLTTELTPSGQAILYFPAGSYKLSGPWDTSAVPYLRIRGDGCKGQQLGTFISGSFPGAIIEHARPNSSALRTDIADVAFYNPDPQGICIHSEGSVQDEIRSCRIDAGLIGLDMRSDCFDPQIVGCRFDGPGKWRDGNIAILICEVTNGRIESCYAAGWTEGLRASGTGLAVGSCRFEVNTYGMRLGMNPIGGKYLLTGSTFSRIDFEACSTAIDVANTYDCTGDTIGIQGHIASPPTPKSESVCGINDHGSDECEWKHVRVVGAFTQAAIVVNQQGFSATPQTADWYRTTATNTLGPSWSIDPKSAPYTTFTKCNLP